MDFLINDYKKTKKDGVLNLVLEDSIMQKGYISAAGSKMLEGFKSPIEATVVSKLSDAGMEILGKTKPDEFSIDRVYGTAQEETMGAITAVKSGFADAALCNDIFGKMKRQAAHSGLLYLQPTYGTVSRYGLIPTASSMDTIGILVRDMNTGRQVLEAIAGCDMGDGMMYSKESYTFFPDKRNIRIGFPVNAPKLSDESAFRSVFRNIDFELKHFEVFSECLYILASAEICNNTNRYDGIKFGYRTPNYRTLNDLYLNSRNEGMGFDTKLASIIGSFVLSQDQYFRFYDKAMKLRRLIVESLDFESYDMIILPADCDCDSYSRLALYALTALAGLPSLAFNYKGIPVHLISKPLCENSLFGAMEVLNLSFCTQEEIGGGES